jgi:hypothetical protein
MEKLTVLGKELGLTGPDLLNFVKEENEKAERREKENREREAQRIEEEIAREERRAVREMKIKELEHAEKEREYELEMERLKSMSLTEPVKKKAHAKMPKLPNFVEGKDSIDAYLKRFERFAENAGWSIDQWATNLSALLQGKALDVYSRLSAEESVKYDVLKESLLKRFQFTEEGFRQKLRSCKMEIGETAQQFVVRMEEYVLRWMGLAKVEETFEGLKDLILREQFMQSSSKALQTFLKERRVKSVTEMAEIADQYLEAHGPIHIPSKSVASHRSNFSEFSDPQNPNPVQEKLRKCYICRSNAHIARECPSRFQNKSRSDGAGAMGTSNRGVLFRGRYMGRRNGSRGAYRGSFGRGLHDRQSDGQDRVDSYDKGDIGGFVQDSCSYSDEFVVFDRNQELPLMSGSSGRKNISFENMPVSHGYVNDVKVDVLRDSGCSSVVVRRDLVSSECLTGETQKCILIDGTVRRFPIASIFVDTPYYTGEVKALCTEHPIYDLILGNIKGVRGPGDADQYWVKHSYSDEVSVYDIDVHLNAVQTRAQKAKEGKVQKLKVVGSVGEIGVDEVKAKQTYDVSLSKCRENARSNTPYVSRSGAKSSFVVVRELLYRHFQSDKIENGKLFKQLCVPSDLRNDVLKLAHDSVMGGHLGIKKTSDKILSQFWWPGIMADVKRYCHSCDICQKTFPKGKVQKVPIGDMPLIENPFDRVAIDLIGPINPPSDRGNRFILTLVDYATRYPEAIALKNIDSETVAEALVDMFSRVGVPSEILSDMGKQFTSDLMKEVGELLSVRQLTTTPYNPSCNGLVEKFNGTIKNMIKKMCSEQPRLWDRYISPLLFAYRETPQASLGFSPFELLFGRTVRGPLTILKELWTKEIAEGEVKTTYQYVVDLRNRIEDTLELARVELEKNSKRYRKYGNVGRKAKNLKVGDKVLVLLPTSNNKLLMHLQGPFEITKKLNAYDYKVKVKGKEKVYHANLLKRYVSRESQQIPEVTEDRQDKSSRDEHVGVLEVVGVAVVEVEGEEGEGTADITEVSTVKKIDIELPSLKPKETVHDVHINPELTSERKAELEKLVEEYSDVFTDVPGSTNLIEHDIKLTSTTPVRSRPYPLPHAMRESFKSEIEEMHRLGIIEPTESPYASPVVIVKKSDGSNRICIDYRKLNSLTVFNSEPIGNQDEIFARLAQAKFLSKIDMAKGYWQIKVKDECVPYTAFVCSEGLFAFKRMPFGLVNSGATFCKMMRKLLKGLKHVENFVDDIIDHTKGWEDHIQSLRELFERLRTAHLTARPSKCYFGYSNVTFLGHVVGQGQIKPNPEKVETIKNCKRPRTKKQVRSFLGLVGYYRKFIPHFSTTASVLTDMTKKGRPNEVVWTDAAENSFRTLVKHITQEPILCLPDVDKQFIMRTDASDVGLGAVLMQEVSGIKFPVAYASRKLLPREQRYSVIEKECLGIVWGIQKFHQYLYGTEFILETDHAPLVYLNRSKLANPRVMRWALSLQPFRFRLVAIKGSENVGADFLSRL